MPGDDLHDLRSFFGAKVVSSGNPVRLKLDVFLKNAGIAPVVFGQTLMDIFCLAPAQRPRSSLLKSRLMLRHPDLADAIATVFDSRATTGAWEARPAQADAVCRAARSLLEASAQSRPSNLGVEFFNDSKALRRGTDAYNLLGDLLRSHFEEADMTREEAYERCQVVANGTAVKATIFGRVRYRIKKETFGWIQDLSLHKQAAVLTMQNLDSIDELVIDDSPEFVITCENETPFCELIASAPPAPVIYTGGYPNAAVRRVLALLPAHTQSIRHWGDSDLDGLMIADILREFRPVDLWRCDIETAKRLAERLLPLSPQKRQRAEKLLETRPDFPFAAELRFALQYGWLEQEAWSS